MKTIKTAVLAFVLLAAGVRLSAQMAVIDAGVASVLAATKADQAIYYAQSILELYNNAQNTYNQFQNMLRAEQRALNNLKGLANVSNFNDFMKWQNRQLYLERESERRYNNLGVKIGSNTYRIKDIDEIPGAMRENYGDEYWDSFSPEQRKKMWTNLGLSPSNYTYLTVWQQREADFALRMLDKESTINAENMQAFEIWKALADKYKADKDRSEDEKIQDKELSMDRNVIAMDTNKVVRDLAHAIAEKNEWELAKWKRAQTPPTPPRLSDHYNDSMFESIVD